MDNKMIGNQLKKAREQIGLSQEEVSEKVHLPRTALVKMEQGTRSVSSLELSRLANLYRVDIASFFTPSEKEDNALVSLFRIDEQMADLPLVKEQVGKYYQWCKVGAQLEDILGLNKRSLPPYYGEEITYHHQTADVLYHQAEDVAEQERNRLGLGFAPIGDIAELINEQNIWASAVPLPEDFSGLFLADNTIRMTILVNSHHGMERKRFSYAHEYAHGLFDRKARNAALTQKSNSSDIREKRANAFAAAFLMPKEGVEVFLKNLNKGGPTRDDATIYDVATNESVQIHTRTSASSQEITFQDVALLAHHFKVSYQAALYRLKSLRFINKQELATLVDQESFGRAYLRILYMFEDIENDSHESSGNREIRIHVVSLAIRAYRLGEISQGKLVDIMADLSFLSLEIEEILKVASADLE